MIFEKIFQNEWEEVFISIEDGEFILRGSPEGWSLFGRGGYIFSPSSEEVKILPPWGNLSRRVEIDSFSPPWER